LQNVLDRIGHFLKISLCAGSALAGLQGPRQRQKGPCAGVNTQGRTPLAGMLERLRAAWPKQEKSLTRSCLNRHGPIHKNKKQALGRNMMRFPSNFRQAAWTGIALLSAVAGLSQPSRAADEWPSRDITFYVPYAPGGSTDPISRKYAELLEKQLKVKVIVENKPGASATIGTGAVIRATPDGYTIGLGSSSSLAYQPLEMKGLAWKSANDYQSIAKVSDLPVILAVPADSRWKTLDDFLNEARANPRKLKVSVSGLRSINDIAIQQLNKLSGLRIVTVPFTGGGGEATLAALGGRVDGTAGFAPGMKGQIDAGKLRVLAVFQQGKYDLLPEAKPIGETPWKDTFPVGYYVIAPNGLPKPILEKLLAVSKTIVESDEFKSFLKANGYTSDPKIGDDMKQELAGYDVKFRDVVKFLDDDK
jgi:tripartite-type tricarboxylate transporter receptor subunit TctC